MSDATCPPAAPPELPEAAAAETDYGLLIDALMQTQRGRWFLSEHARRCRQADQTELLEALARLERAMEREREPRAVPELGEGLAALARIERALEQFRAPRAVPELGESLAALARIERALEREPERPATPEVTEKLAALAQSVEGVRADITALRASPEAGAAERSRDEEMLRLLREQRTRLDSLADIWARAQSASATGGAPAADGVSEPASSGIEPERSLPPADDETLPVAVDERRAVDPASPAGNSAAEPPTSALLNSPIFDLGFERPPREPPAEETQDRTLAALRDALDPTFGLARALANALEHGIDELLDKDEREEIDGFQANAGEPAPPVSTTDPCEPTPQEPCAPERAELPAWLVGERAAPDSGAALKLPDDVVAIPMERQIASRDDVIALPAEMKPTTGAGVAPAMKSRAVFGADIPPASPLSETCPGVDESDAAECAIGLFDAADSIGRSDATGTADRAEPADAIVIDLVEETGESSSSTDNREASLPSEPAPEAELSSSLAPASERPREAEEFVAYAAATAEAAPPAALFVTAAATAIEARADADDIFFSPDVTEPGLFEEAGEAPTSAQVGEVETLFVADAREAEPAVDAGVAGPEDITSVAPVSEPHEHPDGGRLSSFVETGDEAPAPEPPDAASDAHAGGWIDPLADLSAKIDAMLAAASGPPAQRPLPDIAFASAAAMSPSAEEAGGSADPERDSDFEEPPPPRIAPPSELLFDGEGEAMTENGVPAAEAIMSDALRDILAREVRPVVRRAASDPLAAVYALSEEERIALFS